MTGSVGPSIRRTSNRYVEQDMPVVEWTLDGNIHITHSQPMVYSTFEVADGVVDMRRMKDEFVERHLLEPLEDAGFEVRYKMEDESTNLIRRVARFIFR